MNNNKFNFNAETKFFITENLTSISESIVYNCRKLKRSNIIPACYIREGIVGALIRSIKFLSPEVALYLYKSIMQLYMEYSCYVWVGASSCYLELLDKLQKPIEPFPHYNQLKYLLQVLLWYIFFWTGSTDSTSLFSKEVYPLFWLIDCMIFQPPFLDVTKMSMSTVSFLAQLDSGIIWL